MGIDILREIDTAETPGKGQNNKWKHRINKHTNIHKIQNLKGKWKKEEIKYDKSSLNSDMFIAAPTKSIQKVKGILHSTQRIM